MSRCAHDWTPLYRPPRTPEEAITQALHRHLEYFLCRRCGRTGYFKGRGWRRRIAPHQLSVVPAVKARAAEWNGEEQR